MTKTPEEQFAQLLTEAVHRIRFQESKTVQIVQDELGYALGRDGGSMIEYWRKGHLPPKIADIEMLAREIVQRGVMNRVWLETFLQSAHYPHITSFCNTLFPSSLEARGGVSTPEKAALQPSQRQAHDATGLLTEAIAPFIIGPPVIHPRNFFGRVYELKRIFDLWQNYPLQNVAIIGARRSGKTSLLHYLKRITTVATSDVRPAQRVDWLSSAERYQWVLVDFQDARLCHQERLLRYLLTSLKLPVPNPCDLYHFLDIIADSLHAPTIILMDEIAVALESPDIDRQFWWSLRSLASTSAGGNLGFLLTASESPTHLAREHNKSSPFFNIFGYTCSLGPLTEEEARELIASSPLRFAPPDTDWILDQSGRWPYLLQILCRTRFFALKDGQIDDAWQEEGLRQILPFRYLLDEPFYGHERAPGGTSPL